MKEVYSYQEIGTLIDQRKTVAFTCHPEARVTVVQKHPDLETITVSTRLSIQGECVGIVEYEYASMLAVLVLQCHLSSEMASGAHSLIW